MKTLNDYMSMPNRREIIENEADNFESEVYFKLQEAEREAELTDVRYSSEDVLKTMRDELRSELNAGYDDMTAGNVQKASEAFNRFRETHMSMPYRMEITEDRDEGGFVVSFPDLPGCITCGETIESAVANAQDAKKAWLEAAIEEKCIPPSLQD